jgi:hypothetical protein
MTLAERDANFADLYRERKALKATREEITCALKLYQEPFARLSSEIEHDPRGALATIRSIDVEACAELLRRWASVSANLSANSKQITDAGGEVV